VMEGVNAVDLWYNARAIWIGANHLAEAFV
jgi:hypothetical protein